MNIKLTATTAGELVAEVRAHNASGRLVPGDVLPSIRELASQLRLNRNTVASAYAQLAATGVVQTRRRGGTVVLGPSRLSGEGQPAAADTINLSSGNPDPELLPGVNGLLDSYQAILYGADPISNVLRHWVSEHMAPDVGEPHELVLANGAVDAVTRLLDIHLARGDSVIVEEPGFFTGVGAITAGGYAPLPVPVDSEGISVDGVRSALASGARAILCTSRAQNPTGASISPARAAALRGALADYPDVLVIEDDHFAAVSSRPYARITPPGTVKWALVRSVSKYLGPDLRLAFLLTDPGTAGRLGAFRNSPATWVSHMLQHLVARLLDDPGTAELLDRARRNYRHRLGRLTTALAESGMPAPISIDGLNVWIRLPDRSEQHVVRSLARSGWGVRPGADFYVSEHAPAAIRVTSSTITPGQAHAFAADLARIIADHAGHPSTAEKK